jgi:hypothetical protein
VLRHKPVTVFDKITVTGVSLVSPVGAVTAGSLSAEALTAAKIAAGAVTETALEAQPVTTHIACLRCGARKSTLPDGGVTWVA